MARNRCIFTSIIIGSILIAIDLAGLIYSSLLYVKAMNHTYPEVCEIIYCNDLGVVECREGTCIFCEVDLRPVKQTEIRTFKIKSETDYCRLNTTTCYYHDDPNDFFLDIYAQSYIDGPLAGLIICSVFGGIFLLVLAIMIATTITC